MKNLITITLLLIILSPTRSFAWGKKGHTIVVEIAFSLLDEKTVTTVNKYLDGMTNEQVGNWMDEIKGDHTLDYMKPWHYVNIDEGKNYEDTKDPNIINQLTRVIAELQHHDKMSKEDIKRDLLIICHLTGDLHQPLHVGYGKDKGGNTVQLQYNGHGTNLHRIWDTEILEQADTTMYYYQRLLTLTYKQKDIDRLSVINVEQWIPQPRILLPKVYDFKNGVIDADYIAQNQKIAEQQIAVAGLRLAAILKDVFKS